jgi:hypothetical protein
MDPRFGTLLFQELEGVLFLEQLGYVAIWIVQVTKVEGEEGTIRHTGRRKPLFHSMHTEGALFHHTLEMTTASDASLFLPVPTLQIWILVRRYGTVAHWLEILVVPVQVVVLLRILPVEAVHAIGAGHLTVTAADTALPVRGHYAILPFVACSYRADLGTRGIITVHTGPGHEPHVRVRVFAILETKDMHPQIALWGIIFHLTGLDTCPATSAEV